MGCRGCAYWDEPDSENCDGCPDKDFDKAKPAPVTSADHPMSAMPLAKYLNQISQNETPFEECSAKVQRAYLDKATFILGFLQPAFAAQRQAGRDEADDRAFKLLEAFGVPRCRAETVENGIMVLQDRMRKAIESEQMASESLSKRYAALETAARDRIATSCITCEWKDNCHGCAYAKIRKALADLDDGRKR